MSKNKNLKENTSQNFILRGLNSVQIGLYVLLGAYLIKSCLHNFIADENPMGMLSIEIIEFLGIGIAILVFIFSFLAIFFSSRRNVRRSGLKVWNQKSKQQLLIASLVLVSSFILLIIIFKLGYISFLTPSFLVLLALTLFILNKKKKKQYYYLSLTNALLAPLVILIPTYWYSALLISGVGFLVYGIMVRK